jgi:hypothetical protein
VDDPAPEPSVPSSDALAAEVRLVVGRVRSPAGLAEQDLPMLDELAGGRDAVPELLDASIRRIDNEPYRTFLTLLLPFPFAPAAPWEQLGPNRRSEGRGERASREAFGLSWDACNRAGQLLDGRSRRDWAERFLAESIMELSRGADPVEPGTLAAPDVDDPGSRPDDPADPAASDGTAVASSGGSGRRVVLAGVLVAAAAAAVVLAGVVVLWPDRASVATDEPESRATATSQIARSAEESVPAEVDGSSSTRPARISCQSIGALDADTSMEPDGTGLTQRFVDLYRTLPPEVGCPPEPAFIWDQLVVQELFAKDAVVPSALLVQRTSREATFLTPEAYATYRRLGSGDGSIAQTLGGMPAPVVTLPDGRQEVLLSKGVLLVAEQEGAPFFWVPADFVELYRASPQLGRPVGNPLPTLVQDYQFGYGQLYQRAGVPDLTVIEDPGAELPAVEELERTVLRQPDGTAWWIGMDGRRYWIPDGGTWECLVGGRDEDVATVRAYAIASLPYGGHAACSMGA